MMRDRDPGRPTEARLLVLASLVVLLASACAHRPGGVQGAAGSGAHPAPAPSAPATLAPTPPAQPPPQLLPVRVDAALNRLDEIVHD